MAAMRRTTGARCTGRSRMGGPLTETAATGWPDRVEDRRGHAGVSEDGLLAFDRNPDPADCRQLPQQPTRVNDRVWRQRLQLRGEHAPKRIRSPECHQHLAQRGRVRRPPPAGPRRQRKRPVPDDLDEVQHFVSLEHAEVNDFVRQLEQFLKERQGSVPEVAPFTHEFPQLEQADAQAEPGVSPLQQPLFDQYVGEPVHRRLRDRCPRCQLRQRKIRLLGGEAVQQREDAFQHGLGSDSPLGCTHIRLRPSIRCPAQGCVPATARFTQD